MIPWGQLSLLTNIYSRDLQNNQIASSVCILKWSFASGYWSKDLFVRIEISRVSGLTMFRKRYHGCARCNDVLERSQWLLDPKDWKMQKLGSGGNGEVYKARCPETGCEHAAKFLPYPNGRWECDMTELVQRVESRHIVRAICSGVSKHPVGGASITAPKIVLLLELMSEDLFDAVFEPCTIAARMFRKRCALKHVAYQLLGAIQGRYCY